MSPITRPRSIVETHPEMAKLWHSTKNNDLDIDAITSGSGKTVWWLGECGHEWQNSPLSQRDKKSACSYCSGLQALAGFNDIGTLHPHLIPEWSPKNPRDISTYIPGSQTTVLWICTLGHEYSKPVRERVKGRGCPYCSNTKVLAGFNDLESNFPELMNQFDYENNDLKPSEVYHSSPTVSLLWICEQGHSYNATPYKKTVKAYNTRTKGCGLCSGKIVVAGVNDLPTTHPEIANQFHPTKNEPKKVTEVYKDSHSYTYWWVCSKGHEWKTTPRHRTMRGQGCPFCAGNLPIANETDLATTHPHLLKEWDYSKNTESPSSYTYGSETKVWWLCEEKHSYKTMINSRARLNTGCPKCASARQASKGEKELSDFIKRSTRYSIETNTREIIPPFELDIFIPEIQLAIEFNGVYWHSDKIERNKQSSAKLSHHSKWKECKEKGIQLIQIWEDEWNDKQEIVKRTLLHKIGTSGQRSIYARNTDVVQIDYNQASIFLNNNHIQGSTSATHYIALEEKGSGELAAVMLLKQARKDTSVYEIVRYATSFVIPGGFSKLLSYIEKTIKPEILTSFADHCVSNGNLYASNGFTAETQIPPDYKYVKNSKRIHKFNYRLSRFKNDPELIWEERKTEKELAAINGLYRIWDAGKTKWVKRRTSNIAIPVTPMTSSKPKVPEFSLASTHPNLMKEWDYEKNLENPEHLSSNSGKKVWWVCEEYRHSWDAKIINRTRLGNSCPVCSNRVLLTGFNDLLTREPQIASEFNTKKNAPLTAGTILSGSSTKVWWVCHKCSYEWLCAVNNRTGQRKSGCLQCYKNRRSKN